MKISVLSLFASVMVNSVLYAQRVVSEATLNYQINIESIEPGQAAPKPMGNASLAILVKGNISRTDMQSNLGTESTVFDQKSAKGAILKEYSGQKLMITLSADNWAQKNQAFRELLFKTDNADQLIGWFNCKKAVAKMEDGKEITVFYMPDIQLQNNQYNNAFSKLPGIPVQYQLESGKIRFSYTLVSASYDPVLSSKFELPKSGYRVMTFEENQQLRKSGN